jgi:ribosome-associated protein
MDMKKVSAYFDYFIVMSANNPRQIRAISDEIEERLQDEGVMLWCREGGSDTKWVLLDFGDCLVHLFEPDARRFYDLEGLWGDVPQERLE